MEVYEKKAITVLLVDLCNDTTATEQIITYLQSELIVTDAQADEIRSKETPWSRNREIYMTLKKKCSMLTLLKVLRDTSNAHIAVAIEKETKNQRDLYNILDHEESSDLEDPIVVQEENTVPPNTPCVKNINILLLGETGVGKSTWINGIANYLTCDTLEEAIQNELVVLVPSQFTMANENYEEITVPIGAKDPNEVHVTGQSATQYPRTYCFKTTKFNIRIIDTPGIGDTRGIDQDKANFQHIMDHLSYVDVIHGICILVKPDNARLGVAFRFCIQELLTQLHRDAAQNIAFCFTSARRTFYRPGNTLASLRALLTEQNTLSIQIPLDKKTIYCLDNEAFLALAAVKAGQKFEETEQASFSKSWETSVKETARLLNHIQALKPHSTTNTVTLNATRQTIIKLAKTLADMSQNIQMNIALIEDKQKELARLDLMEKNLREKLTLKQVDLEMEGLNHARTVCADPSCTEKLPMHTTSGQETIYKTNYKQVCHDPCSLSGIEKNELNCAGLMHCAAMANGRCYQCGHGYKQHMHITYSTRQVMKDVVDVNDEAELQTTVGRIQATKTAKEQIEQRKRNLQSEQEVIIKTTAKYAVFLKKNSITPYNNAIITYMDCLIKLEETKVKDGGERSMLWKLKELQNVYEEEERILSDILVNTPEECPISLDDIHRSFQELFRLPINGPTIRGFLDTAIKSDQICYPEKVCEASSLVGNGAVGSNGLSGLINLANNTESAAFNRTGV